MRSGHGLLWWGAGRRHGPIAGIHDDKECAKLCLGSPDCKAFVVTAVDGCWLKKTWDYTTHVLDPTKDNHQWRACLRKSATESKANTKSKVFSAAAAAAAATAGSVTIVV
mmetsp:Transcript_48244/g.103340  ORF Transcript_48244/g.103340 Transcript_48244/m.103340 type:complete len:110 (-) Transcript_48244:153-482(-)